MQSGALPKQHIKWNPPPSTSLKINFDGAIFRKTDEAGLGVVVRDHQGRVMASMSQKIKLPSSSDEVEALAAVRAISFALELHLPSIIVKGDSELIISALCHNSPMRRVMVGKEMMVGLCGNTLSPTTTCHMSKLWH